MTSVSDGLLHDQRRIDAANHVALVSDVLTFVSKKIESGIPADRIVRALEEAKRVVTTGGGSQ